ncbi:MAG: CdaR family protein [Thermodesulfobacteriota bacterium]
MKAGKTQRFWRKNIGIKLLALAFALFLWFFVVGEEKAEVSLSVPLELVNMPDDLVISNEFNGMIDVRVYGPRSLVRELVTRRLSHVVDLAKATPGKMTLHITSEGIRLPREVQVTRIHPSQVTLVLEPLAWREVPVEAVLKGAVATGYELKGVELKPAKVVLVGAAREVAKVKKALTRPIDISGLSISTKAVAGLDLHRYHLRVAGEPQVTAYIQVEEKIIRKSLVIPVEGVGTAYGYKINPRNVEVSIKGPVSVLQNAAWKQGIRAVVKLEGLRPGTHVRQPVIEAPSGVEIEKAEPKSVRIIILKK